ncbi:MAG: hypothetical protein RLP15_12970 [Cryomorphaceae bacterium]
MPFKVNISIESNFVRAVLVGMRAQSADVEVAQQLLGSVSKACEENGLNKLMIISELIGPLNHAAAFQLISDPASLGWKPNYRAAVVNHDVSADDFYQFNQMVAANRGLQMRFFVDEAEARAWLFES